MKKQLQLLGLSFFLGCFSLSAQTTHNIDWTTGIGNGASITIEVGDEIIWTNTEATNHDVVSSDPNAPAGFGSATMVNGDTYAFTFNNTVQFSYLCSFHPATMGGQITVVENIACAEPTDVAVSGETTTTANFGWVASPDEIDGYIWLVMNSGDDPDTGTPVDNGVTGMSITTAIASGLTAETDYDFYVATNCGNDGNSGYGGPVSFSTETVGLDNESTAGEISTTVYPNPVNKGDDFNISIDSKESRDVNINVIDVTGKVVNALGSKTLTTGSNNISVESDRLEAGIYFVKISADNNEFPSTVKMIVK